MKSQTASSFLMIRPKGFSYNLQTAATNIFQQAAIGTASEITNRAIEEFQHILLRLQKMNLNIHVFDQSDNETPDAVFPNNWISFHEDGKVILYPMLTANRRKERRTDIVLALKERYAIKEVIDLTYYENENKFLEGTGSIVFDHVNSHAYACLSERTNVDVLKKVCEIIGYKPYTFTASDKDIPIYHTNVMLHIGEGYAVLCAESIADIKERKDLERILAFTGHEVVLISKDQMHSFSGNMLQVQSMEGKKYTLLSSEAIRAFHFSQIEIITKYSELISFDLHTIEKVGGGSTRCMIAEIFCPVKEL